MANAPVSQLSEFFRAMRATKALRGVLLMPGADAVPKQTSPNRIVIWPTDGDFDDPADATVSLRDVQQQLVAEIWGKGSASSADPDAATLADWDATWALFVK